MDADMRELQLEVDSMRRQIDELMKFKDNNRNIPSGSEFQLLRNRVDECEKADGQIRKNVTDS